MIKTDESESIINQRAYLNDYLDKNEEFKNFTREEYIDDGYSGTNENRPAFQRMLEDVKKNNIQTIIVKDLSRFMRDYITLGDYLENIFPFLGAVSYTHLDVYKRQEFKRYRKNYLFKINQIEEQIMTKQEVVRELEKRLKDKESFISNVIPSNDLDDVTRAMLITFIDKVEVLENSQINFVFNNIDTAVSYTHLDVYKRQERIFYFCKWRQGDGK